MHPKMTDLDAEILDDHAERACIMALDPETDTPIRDAWERMSEIYGEEQALSAYRHAPPEQWSERDERPRPPYR